MAVFRMISRKPGHRLCATTPSERSGIAYYARHDDEALCYAIYDHATAAVVEEHRETQLDGDWFWDIAELYGVGLAP